MKKILVILTGGTIGSILKDGVISVTEDSAKRLIRFYEEETMETDRFKCICPFTVLSENETPFTWNNILKVLRKEDLSEYKGVIITHGTDTLSYTSAFLGTLYNNNLPVPVVIVSSNAVIDDPKSNGLDNFTGAVKFIDTLSMNNVSDYNDVYVIWKDDTFKVIRGVEMMEFDTATDRAVIYGNEPFVEFYPEGIDFNTGKCNWKPVFNTDHIDRAMPLNSEEDRKKIINGETDIDARILGIRSYPGMDYGSVDVENYDGVLVYTYHSGTLCTDSDSGATSGNVQSLIEKCQKNGKNIYIASHKKEKTGIYESETRLKNDLIIRLYDMSFEAAYANCCIAETIKKI